MRRYRVKDWIIIIQCHDLLFIGNTVSVVEATWLTWFYPHTKCNFDIYSKI